MNSVFMAIAIIINIAFLMVMVGALLKILKRLGLSKWYALWLFCWPIGLIVLANVSWPALGERSDAHS